jgi:hypothetical protein
MDKRSGLARISGAVQGWSGWSDEELAQITARPLVTSAITISCASSTRHGWRP